MASNILSTYSKSNIAFVKGDGSWLYTKNKTKYLDFCSGIAVNSLGHGNKLIIKAVKNQVEKLMHTSNLYTIPEQEKLASKLCDLTFAEKVFFCNSGAEATDGLIKMIRRYHYIKGNTKRKKIIVFSNAFHGRTITGIQAGSSQSHKEGFLDSKNANGGFIRVPLDDTECLHKSINDTTAGIFIEPIQGEGGINVVSAKFLKYLKKVCNDNDILLGLDEVQSGVGRTGKLFAYQWTNVKPDILSSAKGLGGGFPIGAVLLSKKTAIGMSPGTHGSTFGGNQLACAASMAVLSQVSKESFLKKVVHKGKMIKGALEELMSKYPNLIEGIHGKGLMIGIKCRASNTELFEKASKNKLLLVPAANNVVRLLPPLNTSLKDVRIAINLLEKSLKDLS